MVKIQFKFMWQKSRLLLPISVASDCDIELIQGMEMLLL